jgi:hypothetical protein
MRPEPMQGSVSAGGVVIAAFDTKVWVRWDETSLYPNSDGLVTIGANDLEPEPPQPEPDVAYRNRIIGEVDLTDEQLDQINIATGAELDSIGENHAVKRKGIE